ncbi:hypothetical protein [Actinospica sp.]|jgi:hypothetical protein|uniref:hypothetical protein n=1 Tax=Actinospica sp. TaxID=1872142 RepID=UPI002C05029D|nr:hypothetical protein [Actinospica sp.]HWG23890.1 hypothetical protein [Actinospica sp.]
MNAAIGAYDGGKRGRERGSLIEARQPEWLEVALRMLGPMRPMQARRSERARELIELLGRAAAQHARWQNGPSRAEGAPGGQIDEADAVSGALEGFDPERGASGRPRSLGDYVPGKTKISGSRKLLRHGPPGKTFGSWVRLDRRDLELGDSQDWTVHRIPIATPDQPTRDRRAKKSVAELVWFEAVVPLSPQYHTRIFRERVLLLLDNQGLRLAIVENLPFSPDEVFQLARAAGLPAVAYRVRCLDEQVEDILDLTFPRRGRVKRV